ncbi:MAG: DUF3717 domain-containing protein [Ideonella sp.]|nr:DUF3717 domain-containing protein [Ideonella sp.]MCC7455634.1 DUF3717 domain-containing protein [Nitrospira sp.]
MAALHITDIEAAINWWREHSPSPDGITACTEVRTLAEVYALLVYHHEVEVDETSMPRPAREAWLAWYAHTPDAPCIAICSTAQGDAVCKGCGRTELEVQHWPQMTPGEKRVVWRRITQEAKAWRFNRYAERARRASGIDHAPLRDGDAASGRAAAPDAVRAVRAASGATAAPVARPQA